MKFFLLTAGDHYYTSRGAGDWIATFATHEEAEAVVTEVTDHLADEHYYTIYGARYDWYKIIDLKDWVQS
jgi:hypothetical protein